MAALPDLSRLAVAHPQMQVGTPVARPKQSPAPRKPKGPTPVVTSEQSAMRRFADAVLKKLGLDRLCGMHSYERLANGQLPTLGLLKEVTQEEAREAFDAGEPLSTKGNDGETRYAIFRDYPVVVKKHFTLRFDDDTFDPDSSSLARAKREDDMHVYVWTMLKKTAPECADMLAIPACMEAWDAATDQTGVYYTVQTFISADGYLPVMTLIEFVMEFARKLKDLPRQRKQEIAFMYGKLLACVNKLGVIHGDLHGQNILVLVHEDGDLNQTDAVLFRVIDWGRSRRYPFRNRDSFEPCKYDDPVDRPGGIIEQQEDPPNQAQRSVRKKYKDARMPGYRAEVQYDPDDSWDFHNSWDGDCRGERLEPLRFLFKALANTSAGDGDGVTWKLVQYWVFRAYNEHMQG